VWVLGNIPRDAIPASTPENSQNPLGIGARALYLARAMARNRRHAGPTPGPITCTLVAALTVTSLGGCATRIPGRSHGLAVGNQSASWEVALDGAEVVAGERMLAIAGMHESAFAEYSRRDEALGVAPGAAYLSAGAWSDQTVTTLDRQRRLYLPYQARGIIYFRPPVRSGR